MVSRNWFSRSSSDQLSTPCPEGFPGEAPRPLTPRGNFVAKRCLPRDGGAEMRWGGEKRDVQLLLGVSVS